MNDPLAKFRTKLEIRPATSVDDPVGYEAFDARDRVERLRLRLRSGATRAPGYLNLLDVVSDDSMGTYFVLVFTFMMVRVRGVHLQNVIMAIESGTAAFLQEFDGKRWPKPDPSMPFIESIEVLHEAMDLPDRKSEKAEEEAG